jgi:hypothetical protein
MLPISRISQQFNQINELKKEGFNIYENKFFIDGKEFSLEEFLIFSDYELIKCNLSLVNYDQVVPNLLSIDRSIKQIMPEEQESAILEKSFQLLKNMDENLLILFSQLKEAKAEFPHQVYLDKLSKFKGLQQLNLMHCVDYWLRLNFNLDIIRGLRVGANKWEDIQDKLFEMIEMKTNPQTADIIKKGIDELTKIYLYITNPLEQEIQKIEKQGMERLDSEEDRFAPLATTIKEATKVYDQRFAEVVSSIPQVLAKIHRTLKSIDWRSARHEYLEEGICLGACMAYAAACLKDDQSATQGIQATPKARFIQAHHKLLRRIMPEKMQDFFIERTKIAENIVNCKKLIQSQLAETPSSWSRESLTLLIEKHSDNQQLSNEIKNLLALLEKEQKLTDDKEVQAIFKEFQSILSPNLLRHLKINYEIVQEKPLDYSEFIISTLPILIESCKGQKNGHFILALGNQINHVIANTNQLQRQKDEPFQTEEKLELKAKEIAGENAPPQVIKSIKAKLIIAQHSKTSPKPHSGHAIYLSLIPPYALYDVNLPGLKEIKADTIEEFQRALLAWFVSFPYQTIHSIGQVTSS